MALFQFLQEVGCFLCSCVCGGRVALMPEDDDALKEFAPAGTCRAGISLAPGVAAVLLV